MIINTKITSHSNKALTIMEMVVSLSIMAVVFSAVIPQFRLMHNSWDSKQGSAETIQNGRVFVEHLNRNLAKAVKITAVSAAGETDGYIEFEDITGTIYRCDIAANNYIEFGPVGSLSELAGPVNSLNFTCYGLDDLDTATTTVADIRLVKAEGVFTNPASQGQDKTFNATAFLLTDSVSYAEKIYWADEEVDKIQCSNLDGSIIEDLVIVGTMKPRALALDVDAGKMYWADEEADKIYRSDLDGSNIEDLVSVTNFKPRALALDIVGGKMYWADEEEDKIHRANLDGSSIEDLVSVTDFKPRALALDIVGGKMYWADEEEDKIHRANLDGSSIEDLVSAPGMKPRALALDVDAGKMYWADEEVDKIQRSDLDGSNIEDLVIAGTMKPRALALDIDAGKMYWADEEVGMIRRSDLDGSNIEDLITNVEKPKAMALIID